MKVDPVNAEAIPTTLVENEKHENTHLPLSTDWYYDPEDGLAVHMTVHTGNNPTDRVSWVFGRDLLMVGISGDTRKLVPNGDVKVYRVGDWVYIELSSPTGYCKLRLTRHALHTFIVETTSRVPQGREIDHDYMATELDAILTAEGA